MVIHRMAIIYDDRVRPDTTGVYCHRALKALVSTVDHIHPDDANVIERNSYDLFLSVDDGVHYTWPNHLRPAAFWAIDTHLNHGRLLEKARSFDYVFTAQPDGARSFRHAGIPATWLPLACDEVVHAKQQVAKRFDVCFVGNLHFSRRRELVSLIRSRFGNLFVGRAFFEEMAKVYSSSRVVFNCSIGDDLNMRVFEALCSGSMLLTDAIGDAGFHGMFRDGRELATYGCAEELLDKLDWYLRHDAERERIAAKGRQAVVEMHTYGHRMQEMLKVVGDRTSGSWREDGGVQSQEGSDSSLDESSEPARHSQLSAVPIKDRQDNESTNAKPLTRSLPSSSPGGHGNSGICFVADPDNRSSGANNLTSIVIVTHNQWEFTRQCLESIREHTESEIEIVVVDNGSSDGTVAQLNSATDLILVTNDENRGFPAAANQGIKIAKGEFILLLNNDTVVTRGWLHRMLDAAKSREDIGLVGPVTNAASGPQCIKVDYQNTEQLETFSAKRAEEKKGSVTEVDRLVGFCLLIRRSVLNSIGYLDERFGIGNFEDDDYCRRALQAGFRCVIAQGAFVHHFGGASFKASGIDYGKLLDENKRKYIDKWNSAGGRIRRRNGMPGRPHLDVRLSLCMIVRNNEQIIAKCLESIKPYVDEMIVVDTGSEDSTPQIAADLGARVHHFPWCDSFSLARNVSLERACGEWVFWMDSDDAIDSINGPRLRGLADREHSANVLGFTMQVHCPSGNDEDIDVTAVDHVKMFRNRPDLRFDGRIHEQILPAIRAADGEVGWTDIFVVHFGADHSPEGRRAKHERDLRLLRLEIAERPDHPFTLFNLGMTYADMGRHELAVDALCRSIMVAGEMESHIRKAYALLASSLTQLGRFEPAWRACEKGRRVYPDDPELLFRQAIVAQQQKQLDVAADLYRTILDGHGNARYFSSFDRGILGFKTRHNLALVYGEMGQVERAESEWRAAIKEKPAFRPAWRALMDMFVADKRMNDLRQLLHQAERHPQLESERRLIEASLANVEKPSTDTTRELLRRAVQESPQDLDALRRLARFLFEHGPLREAEKAFSRIIEAEPDDASAFFNLGTVYMSLGKYRAAIQNYETSLAIRPNWPPTLMQLASAHEQLGELSQAIKFAQSVLELNAGDPDAAAALDRLQQCVEI